MSHHHRSTSSKFITLLSFVAAVSIFLCRPASAGLFGRKSTAAATVDVSILSPEQKEHITISRMKAPPPKFLAAEDGNLYLAYLRYDATRKFRDEHNLDTIVDDYPAELYHVLSAAFPQFIHGTDKKGHLVYYEQPGKLDLTEVLQHDVIQQELFRLAQVDGNFGKPQTVLLLDLMLRHYLFVIEHIFTRVMHSSGRCHPVGGGPCRGDCNDSETCKMVIVMDLTEVSAFEVLPKTMKFNFMKSCLKTLTDHYPQRSIKILLINAPAWAAKVVNTVKPWLRKKTADKIEMAARGSASLELLEEYVKEDEIPDGIIVVEDTTTADDVTETTTTRSFRIGRCSRPTTLNSGCTLGCTGGDCIRGNSMVTSRDALKLFGEANTEYEEKEDDEESDEEEDDDEEEEDDDGAAVENTAYDNAYGLKQGFNYTVWG